MDIGIMRDGDCFVVRHPPADAGLLAMTEDCVSLSLRAMPLRERGAAARLGEGQNQSGKRGNPVTYF